MKLLSRNLLMFMAALTTLSVSLSLLNLPAAAQGPAATLSGDWSGTLSVGGTALPLVFHFVPNPDGTVTATFDSPDQGATGLAFSAAQLTGDQVHLEAARIGASFSGTWSASRKTITGQWTQHGSSLPLTLTPAASEPALSRPQEPKPPFPYAMRDVTFPGGASGVTLAGTLTLPPGAGPFPAVVLIAGSGPNDRDETIFGHKPFLLLADTLTRRGVAVLRCDKRGIGQSTGNYAVATTADFADDAHAAVAFLQAQAEIDPKRIGLLGHSEGGIIAPLVASQHPGEVAFVVLLAGTGMPGEKILLAQSALLAKADGGTRADIDKNTALQKQLFAVIKSTADPAAAQVKARATVLRDVSALTPAEKKAIGDPERFADAQSRAVASPWMRHFLTYDPLPALKKTRCPVLAVDGSKDLQVPPAENLALIAKALKAGGNKDVTIEELPSLNHLFQTCNTGSISEYATITETMAPVALSTISDWVVAHTR